MILGLILGFGVGINVGMWFATYLHRKVNKDLINDYKKSVEYWYKNSCEWQAAYFKEINEGYQRVSKMLDVLKK